MTNETNRKKIHEIVSIYFRLGKNEIIRLATDSNVMSHNTADKTINELTKEGVIFEEEVRVKNVNRKFYTLPKVQFLDEDSMSSILHHLKFLELLAKDVLDENHFKLNLDTRSKEHKNVLILLAIIKSCQNQLKIFYDLYPKGSYSQSLEATKLVHDELDLLIKKIIKKWDVNFLEIFAVTTGVTDRIIETLALRLTSTKSEFSLSSAFGDLKLNKKLVEKCYFISRVEYFKHNPSLLCASLLLFTITKPSHKSKIGKRFYQILEKWDVSKRYQKLDYEDFEMLFHAIKVPEHLLELKFEPKIVDVVTKFVKNYQKLDSFDKKTELIGKFSDVYFSEYEKKNTSKKHVKKTTKKSKKP